MGLFMNLIKKVLRKNFCFGAGMYASCTDEEQESASNAVDKAQSDTSYFIEENLKKILALLKDF